MISQMEVVVVSVAEALEGDLPKHMVLAVLPDGGTGGMSASDSAE